MVTVENDHNVILWEKDQTVLEYKIYREGVTAGEYELLTTIPYSSLSSWTDLTSQPRVRSYRYRISATDIYGNELAMGDIHKTMHLTINQGYGNQWNLVWTEYEGTAYSTYIIYRGITLQDMQQIDIIPAGGNTTYTDIAPPTGSNKIYYQIGILPLTPCNPTKNDNVVLSNIATNESSNVRENIIEDLNIYSHNGQIIVNSESDIQNVQVYDITGKLLKTVQVDGNSADISISDFAAGVYMVQVRTGNGTVTRKVVK